MIICQKCKKELPYDNFAKNSSKKSGYNHTCKKCQAIYHKIYYDNNKQSYVDKARKYKDKVREDINDFKRSKGCYFCLENEPCCLDFHHKNPEDKLGTISQFTLSANTAKLRKEIDKCLLVCSNCHRKIMQV